MHFNIFTLHKETIVTVLIQHNNLCVHTLDFGVLLLSIKKSSSVITDSECNRGVDPIVLYLFLLPCGLASKVNVGGSFIEFFEEEDNGELGLLFSTGAMEKRVLEDGEIDELLVVTTTLPVSGFSNTLVPLYIDQ